MRKYKKNSILINQNSGGITIDFIFAITLIMGLSAILLSLSLTLTVASITQYITFATARAQMAAHHTTDEQVASAQRQFNRLYSDPLFSPLYNGNWFQLSEPAFLLKPGDLKTFKTDFPDVKLSPGQPDLFIGFAITFVARILDFQIPFYGSTSDMGGDGSGFTTVIASFLSKEPSSLQCRDFGAERWKAIRKLNVNGGGADYSSFTTDNGGYVFYLNDNGC
ncbi:MAG: hypothetical protein H6625_04950 [Bdellovibrionaceae bacterium]|nr:hypothetical protein [Pseudobdellovibrionaceae bacterium]